MSVVDHTKTIEITGDPQAAFLQVITGFTIATPAHADYFNEVFQQLINNDVNLQAQAPINEVATINHGLDCYPDIRVVGGTNGLGVGPLGSSPIGGDITHLIACKADYLDLKQLKLYVPKAYALPNPTVESVSATRYMITFEGSVVGLQVDLIKI